MKQGRCMNVVDSSAIWRQSLELDTTTRQSFHAGRKLRACVRACVRACLRMCVSVCMYVSTTPTIRSARGVARRSIPRT